MLNNREFTVNSDVLIIGGGFAGLLASIKAREKDVDVVVVDKAVPGRSGISVFAAGIFPYWQPGDEIEPPVKEIVEASEYLVDQDYVRAMIPETKSFKILSPSA